MYSENYNTLMKEIEDNTKDGERDYTMFLDWKNQYCQNFYTTQSNLQIQCNPYQITNGSSIKNLKICIETQKTLNIQSNPETEKLSWRNHAP